MAIKYKFPEVVDLPYTEIRIKESQTGSQKHYHVAFYNKGSWIATMEPIPVDFSKDQTLILAELSGNLQVSMR